VSDWYLGEFGPDFAALERTSLALGISLSWSISAGIISETSNSSAFWRLDQSMARGDHLFVYCIGYSHHGLDLGNGNVIHFDSGPWRKLVSHSTDAPPTIRETTMGEFARGKEVFVRLYDLTDDPESVATRAMSRLGEEGYELFNNNCEHFAVWCKTGFSVSTQVESVKDAAQPLSKGLATAAVLVRSARHLPTRAKPIAYGAALAITAGAFTARYLENRLRNFVRGES
jgi:hypothetical protein